jgi:hypothetical protein
MVLVNEFIIDDYFGINSHLTYMIGPSEVILDKKELGKHLTLAELGISEN